MICTPHHLPRVAVVVDVASPGQRLKADAQTSFCRVLAELVEIGRAAIYAAHGVWRHIAAHH